METTTEYFNFPELLRAYELACMTGNRDQALQDLAIACARSVIKKCLDPQRKTAVDRDTVSGMGYNPAMVAIRNGMNADVARLADLAAAQEKARRIRINRNGKAVSDIVDKSADHAIDTIIAECLTDGIDLVHEAIAEIIAQTALVMPAEIVTDTITPACFGWMEKPYEIRRIKRRVIIRDTDTVQWEVVETTPITEVYKAVRRAVSASRAVHADPRNGYSYIEDYAETEDGSALETIYRRLNKYADLGGYATTGQFDQNGGYSHTGHYTTEYQSVQDYNEIIAKLNLTERQAQIIALRMRGYGYKAIGAYLGVTNRAVINACEKLQRKCEKVGFTPSATVADRITADHAHTARRENVRYVVELLATAERMEAEDRDTTDTAHYIAWNEADKHGVTMRDITEERKRIAWEIACKLRTADKTEDPDTAEQLCCVAYDMADKYGIVHKDIARVY